MPLGNTSHLHRASLNAPVCVNARVVHSRCVQKKLDIIECNISQMFRNTFCCKYFIIELNFDRENKREKGETLMVRDTER